MDVRDGCKDQVKTGSRRKGRRKGRREVTQGNEHQAVVGNGQVKNQIPGR